MVCKPFVLGKLPILGNTRLSSIESQPKKVIVVVVVVIVIIIVGYRNLALVTET